MKGFTGLSNVPLVNNYCNRYASIGTSHTVLHRHLYKESTHINLNKKEKKMNKVIIHKVMKILP